MPVCVRGMKSFAQLEEDWSLQRSFFVETARLYPPEQALNLIRINPVWRHFSPVPEGYTHARRGVRFHSPTSTRPCGRKYLEPTTSVATKVGTGRPFGHSRPPGDGGGSCRWRLGYEEPDAGAGVA